MLVCRYRGDGDRQATGKVGGYRTGLVSRVCRDANKRGTGVRQPYQEKVSSPLHKDIGAVALAQFSISYLTCVSDSLAAALNVLSFATSTAGSS